MYKILGVSSDTSVLCRSAPALLRLSVLRQLAGCAAHLSQAGLHAYCGVAALGREQLCEKPPSGVRHLSFWHIWACELIWDLGSAAELKRLF